MVAACLGEQKKAIYNVHRMGAGSNEPSSANPVVELPSMFLFLESGLGLGAGG